MVEVISLSRAFEITGANTITVITARVSTQLVFGVAGCWDESELDHVRSRFLLGACADEGVEDDLSIVVLDGVCFACSRLQNHDMFGVGCCGTL